MDDHLGDDPFSDRVAPRIGELTAEAQRRGLALEPRLDGDWDLYEQTPDGRRAITVEGAPPGSGLTQELVAVYLSRSSER